jgi:Tol biopolymer transport system component
VDTASDPCGVPKLRPACKSLISRARTEFHTVMRATRTRIARPNSDLSSTVRGTGNEAQIVFTRNGECNGHDTVPTNLVVMNGDGSGARSLTSDGDSWNPSFSPDGRHVAFLRGDSLFIGDAQAKHRASSRRSRTGLGWSPDSSHFFFSPGQYRPSIWVLDLTTGSTRRIAGWKGDLVGDAAWSRDGTRLVFVRELKRAGRSTYALWLIRQDGSERTQLTGQGSAVVDGSPCAS